MYRYLTRRMFVAALVLVASLQFAVAGSPVTLTLNRDAIVVPPMINYQGRLADGSGNPIGGARDMGFKLYAESSGGTAVWSEVQPGVVVSEGLFNVLLGSVVPITALPDGPGCYLEVTVAGEVITPRVRIASAGFSFKSAQSDDADNLGGVPASSYLKNGTGAGGDLTGSYPNPSLTTTGVSAGTYGADTLVPRLTVDAKGRVSSASQVRVGGSSSSQPMGNILRCGIGNIYTVPTGKVLRLYGVALAYNARLNINGTMYFDEGGGAYALPFDPPMQFPAGTVFNSNGTRAATIYGCEETAD